MRNKIDKEINKYELNEVISLTKRILKMLYFVFIAILILASIVAIQKLRVTSFALELLAVISPFFIGFVAAWLLRPLVLKLNTKIKNNAISSLIVFFLFVAILIFIIYMFIPTIYEEVNELVGLLPSFVERITKEINNVFLKLSENGMELNEFKTNILNHIGTISSDIVKELPTKIIDIVASLFSAVGTVAIGLIIGLYMLIDYDSISAHFKSLFPEKMREDVHTLSTRMSVEARKCVNGTFLVALVVLVCDSLGFALAGLNAPLLFGFFCGLTDLIPFIGPYIGGATAVIVGFTQSPLIGILVLTICIIVQIIENYILQPIVMGKASSLHPIVIIISLIVFGHFFGMIGMIVATPLITILRVILEFTNEKIKTNNNI